MKHLCIIVFFVIAALLTMPTGSALAEDYQAQCCEPPPLPPPSTDCFGCTKFKFEGGGGLGSDATKYDGENIVRQAYGSAGLTFTVKGQTPNPKVKADFSGHGESLSEEGYTCNLGWGKNTLDFDFHFKKSEGKQ